MINESNNTDRELWRGPDEGNGSYYADSIHETANGGIGINVGGTVYVRTLREWHRLAADHFDTVEMCALVAQSEMLHHRKSFGILKDQGASDEQTDRVAARVLTASHIARDIRNIDIATPNQSQPREFKR